MKSTSMLIMLGFLLFQNVAQGQQDWTLRKDKNGIKVFTKKSVLYKFDEIKVACEMDGRPSQLVAVLLNVNDHAEWVYKTFESKLLKIISPSELYYYTQIDCPWPFENRDLAVHMAVLQDATTKITTIEIKNAIDYVPEKLGLIRIKYSKVIWKITPLSNNHFKVDYDIQANPGGSLPAWLLNLFISKGPYESFMKLKEQIKLPKYAQAKFSFIAE